MIMTDKQLRSLNKQMVRDNYFNGFNKWFKSNKVLLRLYRAEKKISRKNWKEFYQKKSNVQELRLNSDPRLKITK